MQGQENFNRRFAVRIAKKRERNERPQFAKRIADGEELFVGGDFECALRSWWAIPEVYVRQGGVGGWGGIPEVYVIRGGG